MKRKLSQGILLLFVLALGFCACKSEDQPPDTTQPSLSEETGAEVLQDLLPTIDMGNREFVMITEPTWNEYNYFYADEYNGDPINDTAYRRTMYVENRFQFVMKYTELAGVLQALRNSDMAGGGDYDLVYPHPNDGTAALLTEGLLANLRELPNLHLEREWYSQQQVTDYEVNGNLMLVVSDYSIIGQGIAGLLCNADRYAALGYTDDLYDVVYSGEWTIERMTEIVKDTASVNEGAGDKIDYGLVFRSNSACNIFSHALGENILVRNADGEFELGFTASSMTAVAEALYELLYETNGNVLFGEGTDAMFPTSEMWTTYRQGSSLFITYDFGVFTRYLRELEFEVCYLPYPTLEGGADYRVVCGSGFFAIPAKAENTEESAVVLESLSIYSYEYMRPESFNTILLGRLSENQNDYEMLEYLHNNKFYDFGVTFDETGVAKNLLYRVLFSYNDVRAVTTYMRGHAGELQEVVDSANALWENN